MSEVEEESQRHFREAQRALLGRRWTPDQAASLISLVEAGREPRAKPEEFWRCMMISGVISAEEYLEVTGHKSVISRDLALAPGPAA